MKFNEYKPNYPIFALYLKDPEGIKVVTTKVVNISAPYFPNVANFKPTDLAQGKVVDLTIELNGGSKIYSFPENSTNANGPDGVVFTDREGVVSELTAIKNQSESVLRQVDTYKRNVEDCTRLLSELDPVARKDAEIDARFSKLETSMSDMKDMLTNFIKEFK